ncbi:MAG: hypothetical protein JWP55_1228 [Mycobacterium sp.]|jgi:hypothetical protein|nr:hypothetical protein [Mycobacterium sp.]
MRTKLTCATTFLATPKVYLPTETAATCHTSSNSETTESVPAVKLLPFETMSHRLGRR